MTNEDWVNTFRTDTILRSVIPMELQAGMPMPWVCGDNLLLYVPFYYVQMGQGGGQISEKLFEVYFTAVTKQVAAMKDLRLMNGASEKSLFDAELPSDDRIKELELVIQDYLHQLDKLERSYCITHAIDLDKVRESQKLLGESLIWRQQAEMYKGLGN